MYYKFDPLKDTYIDSSSYNYNFGKDELLQIGNYVNNDDTAFPIRTLIKFDIDDINTKISNGTISSSANFQLKLYECESKERHYEDFYIDCYLISQSWTEGTGSYGGTSEDSIVNWNSASFSNDWDTLGGDYISSPTASHYFITSSGDIHMDITNLVGELTASNYSNYGFLLKLRTDNTTNNFNKKYFYSNETHTIYSPRLYARWDDSSTTGSYNDNTKDWVIKPSHIKNIYYKNEKTKFKFFIREKNPTLSYSTSSIYSLSNTALNNLYYQVKDIHTNEVVIPFSSYTKCSYSGSQNYFYFDMNPLEPYRTYELNLKHNLTNTETIYNICEFIIEE